MTPLVKVAGKSVDWPLLPSSIYLRTRMSLGVNTVSTRLDTDQPDRRVLDEVVECSDGVTASTDTSDDRIRELARFLSKLRLDLPSNDPLEVSNDRGERMRSNSGTDQVVSAVESSDPFSHSLVDSVLQGLGSRGNGHDLRFSWVLDKGILVRLTVAPNIRIRKTLSSCRRTSSAPM